MDKENSKSIDDMLKLLKNKVENSESDNGAGHLDSDIDSTLDTESLKEKLKAQYSVKENSEEDFEGNEYAIDEDFMASVAHDLRQTDESKEDEAEESFVTFKAADDHVEESVLEEAFDEDHEDESFEEEPEEEPQEEPEDETFDEDDTFEDEFSSNVIYADDVIDELSDIEEPQNMILSFDDEAEVESLTKSEPDTVSNDEDDDLPWFDDDGYSGDSVERLDNIENEQESFTYEDTELPSQAVEAEQAEEYLPEDEYSENEEQATDDTDMLYSEELSEDIEDEQLSFYRTITDAEHETMAKIAAMRELEEDSDDPDGEEYDFGDQEILEEDQADSAETDDVQEATEFNIHEALEKKYGISADFYGTSEGFSAAQFEGREEAEDESEDTGNSQKIGKVSAWYITKPIFMGVIALFIFLVELLPIFDIVPGGLLDYTTYPAIYVLIDLQLVLFISALYANKLIDGFNRLLTHEPNTYSILLVTAAITVVYDILVCFCTADGLPNLYGSIIATYILIAQIIDILDRRRVNRSLSSLLMGDGVYTITRSQGKNACADKMYAGGVAPDTNIYEPREIKGTGYVKAFNKDREYISDKTVNYAITPVFIFSALMAVGAMVLGEEFKTVLSSMLVSFVALAPLSAMLSHFLPIYVSYTRLYNRGCFITGHKAAQSVGDCDAMVFGDRHLFKKCDPKESGIKLYTNKHAEELLSSLDAVYSAIGGPMKDIFSGASAGTKPRKVNMVRITRSGLEAIVDDRTNIILGTADYMTRYGIVTDSAGVSQPGILYVAMNSSLAAKISLNYKTEPLFEMLSRALGDNGIETVIHTYDPAIYGGYVAKCRKGIEGGYPISVVHKNKTDYYAAGDLSVLASKTGVFAISSRLKLVEVIIFCKKILKADKLNALVRYISFGLMAVLSTVLMITGAMQHVNLIWVLLHQALLVASFTLISLKILPQSFEKME